MEPSDIATAAERLAALRCQGGVLAALPPRCRPAGLEDSYEIQAALRRLLAHRAPGPCVGFKIGCTTAVMQDYLGIAHPCAGGLYRSTLVESGAVLSLSRFRRIGVELEIAVRLGRDLPARSRPYEAAEIEAAVASFHPSIELVEDRYEDWPTIGMTTLVADDFFSAGCVLGPVAGRPGDLAGETCGILLDGTAAGAGHGRDILGHPLNALRWLADHPPAADGLESGQVITLGSVAKTLWIDAPVRVEGRYESLGSVDCAFVP